MIQQTKIQFKPLHKDAKVPTYGTPFSAGADLYAVLEQPVTLAPGQTANIPTGVSLAIPEGMVGLVFARSGLGCKQGIAPANKVAVIDSDYRGELMIYLHNHSTQPHTIQNGDRIAQIVFVPYVRAEFVTVDALPATERGAGSFGHTGK